MTMQDRAKANHDLGKDSKIFHVLDNGSMAANAFFGEFCSQPLAFHLHISLNSMAPNAY